MVRATYESRRGVLSCRASVSMICFSHPSFDSDFKRKTTAAVAYTSVAAFFMAAWRHGFHGPPAWHWNWHIGARDLSV